MLAKVNGTALLMGLKALEAWEWQYGEYKAGMLQFRELPVAAWKLWYRGEAEIPLPVRDVWEARRPVLTREFVRFMEENVVAD